MPVETFDLRYIPVDPCHTLSFVLEFDFLTDSTPEDNELALLGPIVSSFDTDSFDVVVQLDVPDFGRQTHRFHGALAPQLLLTSFSAAPGSLLLAFTIASQPGEEIVGDISLATITLQGDLQPTAVPEPSSLAMFGAGAAMVWLVRRRRSGKADRQ